MAFFHGNLSVVRMLLNKKANLNANDIIGMTPPHYAVDADRFDCLKYALDNGADLERKDKCGYTLLLRAGMYCMFVTGIRVCSYLNHSEKVGFSSFLF